MHQKRLYTLGGLLFVLAVPFFLLTPNLEADWLWILGTVSLLGISALSIGFAFFDRVKHQRTFFRAVILSLLLFVGYLVLFIFIFYLIVYFNMRHL